MNPRTLPTNTASALLEASELPADPALPGYASLCEPSRLNEVLSRVVARWLGPDVRLLSNRACVRRLFPGKRCSVELELMVGRNDGVLERRRLLGKFYRDDQGATVYQTLVELRRHGLGSGRFLVPEPVACVPEYNLLLLAWALSVGMTVLSGWLNTIITPGTSFLLGGGNFLIGFGLTTLMFAMMFKILPDVQVAWRVVWVGALVTSILFNIGAFLIGLYLGSGGAQSVLGAAGSFVILMIWISYSAQIIFFGAKFALVYGAATGKPILPAAHAIGFKLARLDTTPTDQE